MRRVMTALVLVSGLAGCADRYEPQKTAGSTPTSEMLKLQRRRAKERDQQLGAASLGAILASALGLRREEGAAPPDNGRKPLRLRDIARTDASTVPLTPFRASAPDPSRPPATVPLVVKLTPASSQPGDP